jgi:hypothetical protein
MFCKVFAYKGQRVVHTGTTAGPAYKKENPIPQAYAKGK